MTPIDPVLRLALEMARALIVAWGMSCLAVALFSRGASLRSVRGLFQVKVSHSYWDLWRVLDKEDRTLLVGRIAATGILVGVVVALAIDVFLPIHMGSVVRVWGQPVLSWFGLLVSGPFMLEASIRLYSKARGVLIEVQSEREDDLRIQRSSDQGRVLAANTPTAPTIMPLPKRRL